MIGFISPFQILDYLDRLEIVKQTSTEYHCKFPVCGDGGFKIDKPTGKYQAFKCGCEVKEIREAICPWSEVEEERRQNSNSGSSARKKNDHPYSSTEATSLEIKLARLPVAAEDIPLLSLSDISY